MKLTIAFTVVLLFVAVNASIDIAQVCSDHLIKFGSHPDNCVDYFMCMINRGVWFRCDVGQIWVQERRNCFPGNQETCELTEEPEPTY